MELAPHQHFSFSLSNHNILYLIQLSQLLIFPEILCFKFKPFASQSKQIEQSHLIDQLGCVVGIKEDILTYLAPIEILSYIFISSAFSVFIFSYILLFFDLDIGHFISWIFERYRKIYFFGKNVVDFLPVVVYNIKIVIFGSLSSVNHMQMFHLWKYFSEFLILSLQFGYFLIILNLHSFSYPVLKPIYIILHSQQFVLQQSLFFQQFSHLTKILSLQ